MPLAAASRSDTPTVQSAGNLFKGNRVDFDGLVRSLQDYWSSISAKFPGVDDITVIGIDLTKRSC